MSYLSIELIPSEVDIPIQPNNTLKGTKNTLLFILYELWGSRTSRPWHVKLCSTTISLYITVVRRYVRSLQISSSLLYEKQTNITQNSNYKIKMRKGAIYYGHLYLIFIFFLVKSIYYLSLYRLFQNYYLYFQLYINKTREYFFIIYTKEIMKSSTWS